MDKDASNTVYITYQSSVMSSLGGTIAMLNACLINYLRYEHI